jgi:hypothetical protein
MRRRRYLIFGICIIAAANAYAENVKCIKDENHSYELCGSWNDKEIEEVKSLYFGKDEIHKLIKRSENYYILHTCVGKDKTNKCMGGYVYVFERINGKLIAKPERWDWVF